ncbi:SDR family oxidoreductase [Neomegalonema sp.]|uniref:enoyl-ACP reductase FabI n=1 Tax=Neomegalonema sp. TaxID=2039713 RepID=UPI0026337189|nr:SDR family oxidoreductase [Neomegalonema sp.]MDD2867485.1 SDR family oxidoreductase [Neomegalonema sp.]
MALMQGKRGLIMGVANDHSIAWGISRRLAAEGAELAFTYQGEAFGKRVKPLAESVGSKLVLPADVSDPASLDALFAELQARWGKLDFLLHAIAHSDKNELKGRYVETSRTNFLHSLDVSCFSFVDLARRALPLMTGGGALLTLSYLGSERVLPNYNVMGVAKAALEASVRYLAADLGPQGVRVNALSPGPMRTLAGSAVGSARKVFRFNAENAPLRRNASLDEVAGAALFALSDLGGGVTGEIVHVDSGYHAMGMPIEESLPE